MNSVNSYYDSQEQLQPLLSMTKIVAGANSSLNKNTATTRTSTTTVHRHNSSNHNGKHTNFSPANHLLEWQLKMGKNLSKLKLPFPWKLHQLLDDLEYAGRQDIASWLPGGTSFRIHNPEAFGRDIMSSYFRQSKFSSFIRQLYIYGFAKIEAGPGVGGYHHPGFLRDNKSATLSLGRNQCENDRRCKSTKRKKKGAEGSSSSSTRTALPSKTPPVSVDSFSSSSPLFTGPLQERQSNVGEDRANSFTQSQVVPLFPDKAVSTASLFEGGMTLTTQVPLQRLETIDLRPCDEIRRSGTNPITATTNPLISSSSSSLQAGGCHMSQTVQFQKPSLLTTTTLLATMGQQQRHSNATGTSASSWLMSIEKMLDSAEQNSSTEEVSVPSWEDTSGGEECFEPRTIEEMTNTTRFCSV